MPSYFYNREEAKNYAKKWAYLRNPKYYNFDNLGGDCTNFVSQCLYAGCKRMNYAPTFGWYYIDSFNRAPAWTGVEYFYNFLTKNNKEGPIGKVSSKEDLEIGDIVQLQIDGEVYHHSGIIIDLKGERKDSEIFIATHTSDVYYKSLAEYDIVKKRFIHIVDVK